MEVAISALRQAIVTGTIAPGERVKEVELAASLDMSRTPVREAVRRLVGEGVLALVPNNGATVADWSDRDVREIFEVRALLEGFASGLAAQRATEDKLTQLRELCAQMKVLERRNDRSVWDEYAVLNDAFHRDLFTFSENQQLCTILGSLLGVPLLHRAFRGHSRDALVRSNRQHEEVVEAIAAKDSTWAQSAMQTHVHATRQLLLRPEDDRDIDS